MASGILRDEVPEQLRFADHRRLLSRVALSISLILTVYLCIVLVIMPVLTVGKFIAALAAVLIGSLSWLCHHEKLYTASAATIVAVAIIGGFVASLSNGGADGFVAPIMISAPVTAAVFIGARATLISTIGVVIAIVSLLWLEQYGWVTEAPYSDATLEVASIVMLAASTGICASGVGYFAQAVQTQIRSLKDTQTRLMCASEQLDHAAHHDHLTGVANRQGLHRFLDQVLSENLSTGQKIFLAHIDLDKFKSINDTYGHPVGDTVLKNAANIMRKESNPGTLIARIGGDEFVMASSLSQKTSAQDAQRLCDKLVSKLKTPMMANGVRCQIGASIGYVISSTAECSVDSLMTNADLALYDAKNDGRGCARGFKPEMRQQLEYERTFRIELEAALEDDRVACVLQPQVCVLTGKVIGLEGLGRIRSKAGKLLAPALILTSLAEMGRLAEFDHQVMRNCLDALVALRNAGHTIPYVSVNASAHSLRSNSYVHLICRELEARNLCAHDVVVEVLESTLIENSDDAAAKCICELHKVGIKTIMDDFGSGHATMSNVLKLELDGLKIDRSLIADLHNAKTLKLVRAVHKLAKDLDLKVIMEGVETPQQFAILRRMGCDIIQGFGICEPLEQADLITWLNEHGASEVHAMLNRVSRAS